MTKTNKKSRISSNVLPVMGGGGGGGALSYYIVYLSMISGYVPVTTAWRVVRLRMEERPPDMEGSCEYIE
jgi:Na+/citrate or Na+/malate symporter